MKSTVRGARRKILVGTGTEVSGSPGLSSKVSGNSNVGQTHAKFDHNMTSAANYSTLIENDTAVTVDINHQDHSYALLTTTLAKPSGIQEDHCYNIESPKSLKRKNQASEEMLTKYRKKLRLKCQKSRRLKTKVCTLKNVTKELKKKRLISNQCASLLESINEVLKHILRKIQEGKKSAKYSEELKQNISAPQKTLHFYCLKAYEYVRENFNKALPHSHMENSHDSLHTSSSMVWMDQRRPMLFGKALAGFMRSLLKLSTLRVMLLQVTSA